jgi:hypothetical protein
MVDARLSELKQFYEGRL